MAPRSRPHQEPVEAERSAVELLHEGIVAVATSRTIQTAVLAALDAVVSAGDAIVGRGVLYRPGGDAEVGPVGGSIHQRRPLDHFLADGDPDSLRRVVSGIHHVERAPVVLDVSRWPSSSSSSFSIAAPRRNSDRSSAGSPRRSGW